MKCPPEILSSLSAALSSLPNPEAVALAICDATRETALNVENLRNGVNQFYLLFGTALVFVMHGGFAMLAAGAIRSKNAVNILLQTLMDACASALMWYLIGFGFAFGIGDKPNPFIGDAMFALARVTTHNTGSGTGRWLDFVFQWAFCATAVTIPAGSVAERCNFNAYLCYSTFISAFLYPLVAHWVWCSKGWLGYGTLKPLLRCGMMDFAGSGVVHMLGGLSGLAGAVLLGPRMGRFDIENQPVPLPGHSAVLVVLGTVLLWFGWYGFNPVSTLFIDTAAAADVASRSAVTTTLAGAAGGVGCLIWTLLRTRTFDLYALCNGVLCGFVAVTAGCHVYEPWAAILCGSGAGIIFDLACILLIKLRIDDPLGAAPMHGGCGAYGVLFVGLLAKKEYIMQTYTRDGYPHGLFYGGGARLLACQVIGALTIAGWTLGVMFPFFWILKKLKLLRAPPEEELNGLDISRHYSRAYNMDHPEAAVMPVTAFTNGGIVTYVTKDGGAVGDAIMRAELVGTSSSDGAPAVAWVTPATFAKGDSAKTQQLQQLGPGPVALMPMASSRRPAAETQQQQKQGQELSGIPAAGWGPLSQQQQQQQQQPPLPGTFGVQNNSGVPSFGGTTMEAQLQKLKSFDDGGLEKGAVAMGTKKSPSQKAGLPFAKSAKDMTLEAYNDDDRAANGAGKLSPAGEQVGAPSPPSPSSPRNQPAAVAAARVMMPAAASSRSMKKAVVAPLQTAGVSGNFEDDGADISVHRLAA